MEIDPNSKKLRVRIAPSPTGDPHVGTLRTALFNYLLAKKNNGSFILRVEDTDKAREVPGLIDKIIESLEWVGTLPDEGLGYNGEFGPYLQSERKDLYQKYADELIKKGYAYHCFCSSERLTKLREEQAKKHQPPRYDRHCRALSKDEVRNRLDTNESYVIRMIIPDDETISWKDEVKGEVSFDSNELDDQILLKSDGYPTYHLAVVVDDYLMKINLVLRGEEWLPSTPKHLLLYRYFGWESPQFGHLPLILNSDRSKLSKRHNNTSVLYYKNETGYHPMAMVHFLMFLGWTPEKVRDRYSMKDLVGDFSLDRVGVSPAIFDLDKLNFLSHQYILAEPIGDLFDQFNQWIKDPRREKTQIIDQYLRTANSEPQFAKAILDVVRMRSATMLDMLQGSEPFLSILHQASLLDLTLDGAIEKSLAIEGLGAVRQGVNDLDLALLPQNADERVKYLAEYFRHLQPENLGGRDYLHPTRVALTGQRQSMNMFEYLAALLFKQNGKSEVIERFDQSIRTLQNG